MTTREELEVAIVQWRRAGKHETNYHMKEICERTAQALEIQRDTGVAVCSCCHKPLSQTGCDNGVRVR